jgi:pimeloyl-ACP methyl ester carboxylesterase
VGDSHTYPDLAADLAEVIAAHGGVADVVGHSMGGKAAMALALGHPEHVRRLVVADIAPVAYGHTQQPMIDAMRSVDLSTVERRGDADAQLAPLVPEDGVRAFLLQSLDVAGKRWRLNLDALSANMDAILGWPEIEAKYRRWRRCSCPAGRRTTCSPSTARRSRRCSRRRNSRRSPARAIGSTPRNRGSSRPPAGVSQSGRIIRVMTAGLPHDLMHHDRADMGEDQHDQQRAEHLVDVARRLDLPAPGHDAADRQRDQKRVERDMRPVGDGLEDLRFGLGRGGHATLAPQHQPPDRRGRG